MSASSILDIQDLTVRFHTIDGVLKVTQKVNIQVRKGEMVGVVGETGCGKSVTAKLVLGILPMPPGEVESGKIMLSGQDLLTMPTREREGVKQKVAYIPQDPMSALNPTFTIGDMLVDRIVWLESGRRLSAYFRMRRPGRTRNQAREQAARLLRRMDIPGPRRMLKKYPIELSGGMRQRVLMAMSLIGHPVLMVADEPTTALDVTIQKRTLKLIMDKVAEERLSGLYITHDLGVARMICQRTYVMYAGCVVEAGPTAELLDQPFHPYTQGLVGSIPKLTRERFSGIRGLVPDYLCPPPGCRFHPRCDRCLDICRQETPSMVQVGPDHWLACHNPGNGHKK